MTVALAFVTVSVPAPVEAASEASPANEAVRVWLPAARPPALAKLLVATPLALVTPVPTVRPSALNVTVLPDTPAPPAVSVAVRVTVW